MSFRIPTTVLVTPTLSPKTLVAANHTVSNASKNLPTSPHTPKSQTVPSIPICPHAPQKSLTLQNGPPVKAEAIASDVFQNALQVPGPLTPPSVTVCPQSPIPPTKPLRGLPYRAPSTWGPRRGVPVQAPKVEAEAVIARVDSFMSVPALTSLPVACGSQPGKFKMVRIGKKASTVNKSTPVKTRTKIPQPGTITPSLPRPRRSRHLELRERMVRWLLTCRLLRILFAWSIVWWMFPRSHVPMDVRCVQPRLKTSSP
ncbi:hypothetical protein BS47DRAFT_587633 [Hydnum rufescens UP504]|uniref:Uncharacterized protein n=1 Tax=Hydnum rufescens UP504 TaxID=1448309 RepID=A0A9P6B3U2_9AGAM|nr:hypothetical protein BS47DRAFT_587633 [Hydnum rufescens UP504]